MITETISQRFNASLIIQEKLSQIIEAFVNFYGEKERSYIEDKFKKWIYVKFLDTIFCRNLPYLNLFQFLYW